MIKCDQWFINIAHRLVTIEQWSLVRWLAVSSRCPTCQPGNSCHGWNDKGSDGRPLATGNCLPCRATCDKTHPVVGKWPETFWTRRTISSVTYKGICFCPEMEELPECILLLPFSQCGRPFALGDTHENSIDFCLIFWDQNHCFHRQQAEEHCSCRWFFLLQLCNLFLNEIESLAFDV